MNNRNTKKWGKALIVTGVVFFVLSTPCLFGGVLGMLGILADVGPEENEKMGHQSLRMAIFPLGFGVLVLVAGLLMLRSRSK